MTKSRGIRVTKGESLRFFYENVAAETDECVLWPYTTDTPGYGRVWVRPHLKSVHIMACEYGHGPKPSPAHQAAHLCGVRVCMNPRHLRWATPSENNWDKARHGTLLVGEEHPNARLKASDVLEIRKRAATETARQIQRDYPSVGVANIYQIINRRRWKSL